MTGWLGLKSMFNANRFFVPTVDNVEDNVSEYINDYGEQCFQNTGNGSAYQNSCDTLVCRS